MANRSTVIVPTLAIAVGLLLILIGGITLAGSFSAEMQSMYGTTEQNWRYASKTVYIAASCVEVLFGVCICLIGLHCLRRSDTRWRRWLVVVVGASVMYVLFLVAAT